MNSFKSKFWIIVFFIFFSHLSLYSQAINGVRKFKIGESFAVYANSFLKIKNGCQLQSNYSFDDELRAFFNNLDRIEVDACCNGYKYIGNDFTTYGNLRFDSLYIFTYENKIFKISIYFSSISFPDHSAFMSNLRQMYGNPFLTEGNVTYWNSSSNGVQLKVICANSSYQVPSVHQGSGQSKPSNCTVILVQVYEPFKDYEVKKCIENPPPSYKDKNNPFED
jgi:hypothetical protein